MIDALISGVDEFTDDVAASFVVPENLQNTILVTTPEGKFTGRASTKPASIVETTDELETQKGVAENFQDVFKWWKRISRGDDPTTDSFNTDELNAWTYDQPSDSIKSTINSVSVMGFVSPEKFDDYVFEVQISSTDGDDDFAGVIVAYALDKATGLTHTLSVMRGGNGAAPMTIDVDYFNFAASRYRVATVLNGLTWMDGTVATGAGLNGGHGGWSLQPNGCRVKVTRKGDILTIETTQMGSTVYFEPAKTIIDLSTDPNLAVFRGPQSFGYTAMSQGLATWKVFQRPERREPIIDIRDWSKWVDASGTWTKVTSTKAEIVAEGWLAKEWLHFNVTTGKYYYMDSALRLYRL